MGRYQNLSQNAAGRRAHGGYPGHGCRNGGDTHHWRRAAKDGLTHPFTWRATFTVHHTASPDIVRIDGRIVEGDAVLAAPTLVGRLGERMAVKVDDTLAATLVVTERAP